MGTRIRLLAGNDNNIAAHTAASRRAIGRKFEARLSIVVLEAQSCCR